MPTKIIDSIGRKESAVAFIDSIPRKGDGSEGKIASVVLTVLVRLCKNI